MSGFNAMHQLHRLAFTWDYVEPAARDHQALRQPQDLVGDGIPVMMIVEQPSVKAALGQGGLNCFHVHNFDLLFNHSLPESRFAEVNPPPCQAERKPECLSFRTK